jgi:hypothetical protein
VSAPSGGRPPRSGAGRRRALLVLAAAALVGLAVVLASRTGASRAAYSPPPPTPQPDASAPATNVVMLGATPEEAGASGSNETWGVGAGGRSSTADVLVRYADQQGWSLGPALPSGFGLSANDPRLAGRFTRHGTGVLVGTIGKRKVVLVRPPGGSFKVSPIPGEPEAGEEASGEPSLLGTGEEAFGERAPLIAPLDEGGGSGGALLVPEQKEASGAAEHQVLHWDGTRWTSEPIAIPVADASSFRVLALDATAPDNAWLLAQLTPTGAVALFRRVEEASAFTWKPVALEPGGGDGEAHPLGVPLAGGGTATFAVPGGTGASPKVNAQLLTVTGEGVWIDGERTDTSGGEASVTMFFRPEGSAGGRLQASWCLPQPSASSDCTYPLPQALPQGTPTRSIAWAGGGPFGQRVITGLPAGVSLRLEASTFAEALSLGAGAGPIFHPGSEYGAAFSSPGEGWIGGILPIHMTSAPVASQLRPWPVPFRRNLQAIAPQPGAPVAALGSQALAVGLRGAVGRYKPGLGWVPESLFGPGEKVERKVNLRAVAWPTPMRAYAVGDEGQMWLWRGETELWERDPATPIDFRGNLLGVAFDPANPSRGYAVGTTEVGSGGVLLRYGKTWTEEAVPPEAQGASLLGIAFAGSEALVPYVRVVQEKSGVKYVAGLLANAGSGWRVDTEAASLIGAEHAQPEAVAGLPDGGAAFATQAGDNGPRVYERQGPGAPWQATPAPLPGLTAGGLALFREGGSLRALVSGSGVSASTTAESPSTPGLPGTLGNAAEPTGGPAAGTVVRQDAVGWTDERHEVEIPEEPEGGYANWDQQYTPDPVMAMLVDPSGSYGWTVGGHLGEDVLQTADVERFGEDATQPQGFSPTPLPTLGWTTLAIGGHAECDAPCAERSLARVGPQVWMESAVRLAANNHASAFVYTGPSVTEARVGAHREKPVPFATELEKSAQLLSVGGQEMHTYVVPSAADLDARPEREGTEQTWESVLGAFGFPQKELIEGNGQPAVCASTVGCEDGYYAVDPGKPGAAVRLIVLDETAAEVSEAQLQWLEGELEAAHAAHEPAIAVGAGDITAQIAAGRTQSAALARILVTGRRSTAQGLCARLEREHAPDSTRCDAASAYFFDSPEVNEQRPLRSGGESIPSFGSGTLGYVNKEQEAKSDFHGASGILLAQVNTAGRVPASNKAEVQVPLIPVIGELALEAKQGTLLRRSEPAVFAGLARRPRAGCDSVSQLTQCELDPYIPIPSICSGECGTALLPEYGFRSSDPEIGAFVQRNLGSGEETTPLLGPEGKPIRESEAGAGAKSGLFCAFNPGKTTIELVAGGYKASVPVTVQPGSVREPCGTVKLNRPANVEQPATLPPAPPPGPLPSSAAPPVTAPLILPPPPAPVTPRPPTPAAHVPLPAFFVPAVIATPLLPFVPPPVPTPARPTPPSGTSAVTSPVEAVEKEEEEEEATESVSNQAVAYRASESEPTPLYVLGIVTLAAFAGASVRRRPRRGRRGAQVATATVLNTERSQRRLGDLTRRRRG